MLRRKTIKVVVVVVVVVAAVSSSSSTINISSKYLRGRKGSNGRCYNIINGSV